MSRFKFRLARTHKLRQEQEDLRARALEGARAELQEAQRIRDDLRSVRIESYERLRRVHSAGGSAGHLRNLEHVLEELDRQILAASRACTVAEDQVARSLREYASARERRRMLDQIRERRHGEWARNVQRAEQEALDEIALGRFSRSRVVGGGS